MNALTWLVWLTYFVLTCAAGIALPMAAGEASLLAEKAPPIPAGALLSVVLVAVSLWIRFRIIPKQVGAGRLVHPSPRMLVHLIGAWSLCFFSIFGAIEAFRASGSLPLASAVVVPSCFCLFLEAPVYLAGRSAARPSESR